MPRGARSTYDRQLTRKRRTQASPEPGTGLSWSREVLQERDRDEFFHVLPAALIGVLEELQERINGRVTRLKRRLCPALVCGHKRVRQDLPLVVSEVFIKL